MSAGTLLFDVGNTFVKWAVVRDGRFALAGRLAFDELKRLFPTLAQPEHVLCASVASPTQEAHLLEMFPADFPAPWFARSRARLGDLMNSYADPAKMGADRWLAMLAARVRSRERVCVVDVGSALTIDFVSHEGQHEGGYIIPGRALMLRALTLDTDRVRFETVDNPQLGPGHSTAEAVEHGVLIAQSGAIRLALEEAEKSGPVSRVLLCGGGAEPVAEHLGRSQELTPNLVFEGLCEQAFLEQVVLQRLLC
ncbi:MAG: type III pantothenate kinase [Pseudomonadota bacterium]